jgi:manganese-dependent inorganic pyrophosphatase
VSAEEIIRRDAKLYHVRNGQISIAQIEVVGGALDERKPELLKALQTARVNDGLHLYALMVTDVLSKGTELLVAGDTVGAARAFGVAPGDGEIDLPGVMSRKKEVAPKLLAAL